VKQRTVNRGSPHATVDARSGIECPNGIPYIRRSAQYYMVEPTRLARNLELAFGAKKPLVRTSTAKRNSYVCPQCNDELNRDLSGRGFVSHKTNANCDFEKGERDALDQWRQVTNNDHGSLLTGDVQLWTGARIRIRGEAKIRTITFVMGSDRNGWRACFRGQGVVPTGPIEWQIVEAAFGEDGKPKTRRFDFHTIKGAIELVAAVLAILGSIGGFLAWLLR
jgi:hypothetical protein